MSLMCIDIGNTNIVSGIYSQDKLTHVQRIETSKDAINQKLDLSLANNVAISSVVPKIHQHILNSSSNNSIFSVSHTNSNIKLDVTKPEDVGNDRLCNMKSIITLKLYPAIIIDFGFPRHRGRGLVPVPDVWEEEGLYHPTDPPKRLY